jgi:hypothetical protein
MINRLFVSASASTDISKLLQGLNTRGVKAFVASDVIPLGEDVYTGVRNAIEDADAVLVVLGARDNAAAAFDAGVASALGKKVVVLADKRITVPTALSKALLVRGSSEDVDAVAYALDHVADRPLRSPYSSALTPTPSRSHDRETLGNQSDILLSQINRPQIDESDVIKILTYAIESSGAIAVENAERDVGFDLGVWSDELESIGANPLLVEFTTSLNANARKRALTMLRANRTAQVALLVYSESSGDSKSTRSRGPRSDFPLLAISVQTLLKELRVSTFPEVVRRLRNRSVHGEG